MRNLSQIEKGGMRSSFLTMFSGTAGAGLLSLPQVLSLYGVTMGLSSLFVFGLLTHRTYKILNELINESGRKSYANVCSYYFGKVIFINIRKQPKL